MTVPRRSVNMIAGGSTLQGANAASIGRHQGRGFLGAETKLGTIGTVVPWPHTVDTNGQAFPAGLLGVTWTDSYATSDASFNAGLIAVPDTLPSGYLARGIREHQRGVGQDSSRGQYGPFSLSSYLGANCTGWKTDGIGADQAPRIRGASALTSYPFFPENLADNAFHYNSTVADGPVPMLMGLRYLRTSVVGSLDPIYYDKAQIQIVRYTSTSTVQVPDPVTGLFPVDATLWTSSLWLPGVVGFDTGYLYDVIDLDFKAPSGTRCFFQSFFTLHTAATNPADPPNIWRNPPGGFISAVQHWWGPRLNIPFPFLICGETNQYAPGGVVSGILPGYP